MRLFIVAFALDGPEVALHGLRHKVNPRILAAKILLVGEFVPEPDVPEPPLIQGRGLQVGLHKALKTGAFIAF